MGKTISLLVETPLPAVRAGLHAPEAEAVLIRLPEHVVDEEVVLVVQGVAAVAAAAVVTEIAVILPNEDAEEDTIAIIHRHPVGIAITGHPHLAVRGH